MPEREVTPTQSALLELKEERAGMQEGYSFLDEKRLILASEILVELRRFERDMEEFHRAYGRAAAALEAAASRHGLEGLEVYPAEPALGGELQVESRSVLGVVVQEITCKLRGQGLPPAAVEASPEAEQCRDAFRDLIPRAVRLAALAGNLERLRLEYTHSARRARALEDVLLPEIDDTIKSVGTALEELEREEAIRVRQLKRGA